MNLYLTKKMRFIKSEVVALIEKTISRKVTYESISPSIFRYLEIRNLIIYRKGTSGTPLIRIRRIRLNYSIVKLLKTKSIADSLRKIVIINSRFEIDLDRNRDILKFLADIQASGSEKHPPLVIPTISGSNISLFIRKGATRIEMNKVFFDLTGGRDIYGMNLRGWSSFNNGDFNFETRFKLSGNFDPVEMWAELKVRFASLKSNYFSLKRQTLQLSFKKNELKVYKIQDRNPIDISAVYNFNKEILEIGVKTENFKPKAVITLAGKLASNNRWLNLPITTDSRISYDLTRRRLFYSSTLRTELKGFRNIPFMRISTKFEGDNTKAAFKPLHVVSDVGTIIFYGDVLFRNLLPSGLLQVINLNIPESKNLDATFLISRKAKGVSLKSDRLIIGSSVFDRFSLSIVPEGKSYRFRIKTGFSDTVNPNEISLNGKFVMGKKNVLETELRIVKVQPRRVFEIQKDFKESTITSFLEKYLISANLKIITDFQSISIQSDMVQMDGVKDQRERINFAFALNGSKLSFSNISGKIAGNIFAGEASAQFQGGGKINFDSNISFNGNSYQFKGSYVPRMGIVVDGSYGTNISVIWAGRSSPSVDICTENMPVTLGKQSVTVSTCIQGEITSIEEWNIVSRNTSVDGLKIFPVGKSKVDLTFNANPGRIKFSTVKYSDIVSSLKGEGNLSIDLNRDNPLASDAEGWILIKSDNTKESYQVNIKKRGNTLDAKTTFRSSPLERFGSFNIQGKLSGKAEASDLFNKPKGEISVTLEEGQLNSDPINLGMDIVYSSDNVTIKSLNVGYLTHSLKSGHGVFEIKKGIFNFIANYIADYSGRKVDLILSVNLSLGKNKNGRGETSLPGNIFNEDFKGNVLLSGIKVDGQEFQSWSMKIIMKNHKLTFDGGPGDTIHGLALSDGNFKLIFLEPFPLQGEANGTIRHNIIDADLDVKTFDLSVLNFVMQSDVIQFVSGSASGKVSISGPINDPDFLGLLNVDGGVAKSKFSPILVKPLKTSLLFSGKQFSMQEFKTYVGDEPLVSKGIFYIDHWIPYAFDISFDSVGKTGVRFSYDFGPLVVDGYVKGSLNIKGDDVATFVDGDISASYSKVSLGEIGQKVFEINRDVPPTVVRLNVETGKRFEFFWPSINFPILRAFTELGDTVNIRYDERDGSYSVKGEVGIQGGEVFYFDRSFYLKNGKITFNENEESFDPIVQVLAEIREQDKNGEPVKIYLEANSKISAFSPHFYSDPPRPDVEILSMIGGSIFNRIQEQGIGLSAVILTSELVSQFGILRPFENAVRDFLGLDLFSIRTQIIQNILMEKILGNVSNPLDNTTLSLGKYLGNDLFLEMLVRFRTMNIPLNNINYFNGLSSDIELNLEWTTPFFLMEWSLIPKHPEDLFLSDNSITFKWKYSY